MKHYNYDYNGLYFFNFFIFFLLKEKNFNGKKNEDAWKLKSFHKNKEVQKNYFIKQDYLINIRLISR